MTKEALTGSAITPNTGIRRGRPAGIFVRGACPTPDPGPASSPAIAIYPVQGIIYEQTCIFYDTGYPILRHFQLPPLSGT
jgi:hypothetical protein